MIKRYLGRPPDLTLINSGEPEPEHEAALERDGLHLLRLSPGDTTRIEAAGTRVLAIDLLARGGSRPVLWAKQETAYHDMDRTADWLLPEIVLSTPAGAAEAT